MLPTFPLGLGLFKKLESTFVKREYSKVMISNSCDMESCAHYPGFYCSLRKFYSSFQILDYLCYRILRFDYQENSSGFEKNILTLCSN